MTRGTQHEADRAFEAKQASQETNESNRNIPRWCMDIVKLSMSVEASHIVCPGKHKGSHGLIDPVGADAQKS
jgi:hypothetical protein